METIYDIIQSYADKPEKWLYYSSANLNPNNVLNSSQNALNFIKDYFGVGGKSLTIMNRRIEKYEPDLLQRSVHIVSTFFLGLKIAECFGVDVTALNDSNMGFRYRWFLSCLYHDIGYTYEKHASCDDLRMVSADGLDAIQEVCNIKYLHEREFKTYSKSHINRYLKGRATCENGRRGVLDHGIIGGLLLYDGLRKQFEESWKKKTDKNASRFSFDIDHNGRTLHCSNTHFKEYAKAADAIIAHNVWRSTLIGYLKNDGKETPDLCSIGINNTLCFILCLADTIEPSKRALGFLRKVVFCFQDDRFSVEAPSEVFEITYKCIKDLENWLDVTVDVNSNSFTIKPNR